MHQEKGRKGNICKLKEKPLQGRTQVTHEGKTNASRKNKGEIIFSKEDAKTFPIPWASGKCPNQVIQRSRLLLIRSSGAELPRLLSVQQDGHALEEK